MMTPVSMDHLADLIGSMRRKGVRLWAENGQLKFRAPRGALTPTELKGLGTFRSDILALLDGAAITVQPDCAPGRGSRLGLAPLAFSQSAHWNLYQLSEHKSMRHLASVTRLRGRLDMACLRKSFTEAVRRHEALRTRIVVKDGLPMQDVQAPSEFALPLDDLTAIAEGHREAEVERRLERLILEPIDVASDPLFVARVLKLGESEHVLVMGMEHMISDGFSRSLLLRDVFAIYARLLRGEPIDLPAVTMQFADYAQQQQAAHSSWMDRHGAYWHDHLSGCVRVRFPADRNIATSKELGWASVPLRIGKELKAELHEWCRQHRTTLVMSAFTAYVALVLRWCRKSDSVVQYQFNSRVATEIENTVGYFASVLYMRMGLEEEDSFDDLLRRVTKEYCNAWEHADFSFLASRLPRPGYTRNTFFNWAPEGAEIDVSTLDGTSDELHCEPVRFIPLMLRKLALDHEPGVQLYDAGDEITGDVYFPVGRFSTESMERFARGFLILVRAMVKRSDARVKDVSLALTT